MRCSLLQSTWGSSRQWFIEKQVLYAKVKHLHIALFQKRSDTFENYQSLPPHRHCNTLQHAAIYCNTLPLHRHAGERTVYWYIYLTYVDICEWYTFVNLNSHVYMIIVSFHLFTGPFWHPAVGPFNRTVVYVSFRLFTGLFWHSASGLFNMTAVYVSFRLFTFHLFTGLFWHPALGLFYRRAVYLYGAKGQSHLH